MSRIEFYAYAKKKPRSIQLTLCAGGVIELVLSKNEAIGLLAVLSTAVDDLCRKKKTPTCNTWPVVAATKAAR